MLDNFGSEWSANYRKMDYERFFKEYSILDEVSERRTRKELASNKDHIFTVMYDVKVFAG